MPPARAVQMHLNLDELLVARYEDPRSACDPSVIRFLHLVLQAWFAIAPQESSDDPWYTWAQRCGIDSRIMKEQLAPTLDLVLESLLRMWKLLDPLCKDFKAGLVKVNSIAELLRRCVPEPLFGRLPHTHDRLEKYRGTLAAPAKHRPAGKVSLTAHPACQSLRPGGR